MSGERLWFERLQEVMRDKPEGVPIAHVLSYVKHEPDAWAPYDDITIRGLTLKKGEAFCVSCGGVHLHAHSPRCKECRRRVG